MPCATPSVLSPLPDIFSHVLPWAVWISIRNTFPMPDAWPCMQQCTYRQLDMPHMLFVCIIERPREWKLNYILHILACMYIHGAAHVTKHRGKPGSRGNLNIPIWCTQSFVDTYCMLVRRNPRKIDTDAKWVPKAIDIQYIVSQIHLRPSPTPPPPRVKL